MIYQRMFGFIRMNLSRPKAFININNKGILQKSIRTFASKANDLKNIKEEEIQKSVFISQSSNIFTNLALEDWFYRNYDFTKHHVLLLWKNDPCVVIGRHQNPWLECNTGFVEKHGIALARRNSGGGTVYHDFGNLNLTFFTPRERYNRRYNLEIIKRALYREWGLECQINQREDIVVGEDFKVSGTAAKLGRPNAYHHCTLLIDSDTSVLKSALMKVETGITTNATQSTRAVIKNLRDVNHHVCIEKLISAVGWEYLRTTALNSQDGGPNLIQKQKGFQMINPTEDWFPGLNNSIEKFASWDWNFGKTPKFTVSRDLEFSKDGNKYRFKLAMDVTNGIIETMKMTFPPSESADFNQDEREIINLCGRRYNHDIVENIIEATGCKVIDLIVDCPEKIATTATSP